MKGRYGIKISQNIIRALLLIILTSMVAFALMKASPVDPLQANVGQAALGSMSQEQIGKLREYWGVGTPCPGSICPGQPISATGDMGTSLLYRQPVKNVIAVKLSNSLFLMVIAWIISGVLGFALGAIAGMNEGRWIDKGIKGYCLLISSTPAFWLALLLLVVFGVWLRVIAHWNERAHRSGGQRSYIHGSGISCDSPGSYLKHYRRIKYRASYPGEDD